MKTPLVCHFRQFQAIGALLLLGSAITPVFAGGKVAVWGDNTFNQSLLPNGLDNVKAIAAGARHSLALKADGTLAAWGQSNNDGANVVPAGLTGIKAIAAGCNWNVALKTDGTVTGWGAYNTDLHLTGLSNVTAIAAGWYHWLALKGDGSLVTWSAGTGAATPNYIPAGISNVIALAAGSEFSLALHADGTVTAWGANGYGQTNVPPGLSNVIAIATSAASSHVLALKSDGRVVAWGANGAGQTNVPPGLTNIIAVAAGHSHSLALTADGLVVAWGNVNPDRGQTTVPPGLARVKAIAAGEAHNLALVFEGPPEILTAPADREVFYQSNTVFTVAATGTGPLGYRWYFGGNPLTDSDRVTGTATASVSIANAQFSDAGVYSVVVSNAFGLVASTGATLTVVSPPFITQQPTDRTVRAGTDVTLVAAADGTAPLRYQWNFNGTDLPGATANTLVLGNAQPHQSGYYSMRVTNLYGSAQTIRALLTVTNSAPYFLRLPSNQVAVLGGSAMFAALARGTEPLRYQWRFNGGDLPGATNATLQLAQLRYDQSGFYTVEVSNALGATNSPKVMLNVSQLMQVGTPFSGNTNLPFGLSNVLAVAAGGSHSMALKSDGTVRVWVANNNYIFDQAAMVAATNVPAAATNVIAIAAGRDHCLALRSNGTVVAWGGNGNGQSTVPQNLSNVISIAAGWYRSYAVKSDGTVTGWGSQSVVPTGLSNIVALAAGPSQNLALKRDGSVSAWGSGSLTNLSAGLSNIIALAAGQSFNLALRRDGTIVGWAGAASGVPQSFTRVTDVVAIAAGSGYTGLALRQDGALISTGFEKTPFPITNNISAIAAGGVQSSFGLAVLGNGVPVFTQHPVSQSVTRSNTVHLHARAAGVLPIRYQWLRDGATLPGATNSSLTLSNVLGASTGNYQLLATNALGIATSRMATISIPFNTNLAVALNLTNLQWGNLDRSVPWFAQNRETHDGEAAGQSGATTNGGTSSVQVFISTPGTLTFWWKVSSEEGFDFLRVYVDQALVPLASISGETAWEQRTITFNTGSHSVRWVYGKDGSVSAGRDAGFLDQVIFIPPPPTATIQPSRLTVPAENGVSFTAVTASAAKPVNYQWMRYGTNLPGATNQMLTFPNLGRKDRGPYSVRVSNAGGSVVASNATVTVTARQRLGPLDRAADGSVEIVSRDATGGWLTPQDLPFFEAQASTNLIHWQPLWNGLSITNGALLLRDPEAAGWPQRFYRVVEH